VIDDSGDDEANASGARHEPEILSLDDDDDEVKEEEERKAESKGADVIDLTSSPPTAPVPPAPSTLDHWRR